MAEAKTEKMNGSCKELFEKIVNRQIAALMFHDKMADLYDFLGLYGFKRVHEYQYLSESTAFRGVKRYFINHHNMLLSDSDIHPEKVIPADWIGHTRYDVNVQIRRQYVQKSIEDYCEWEKDTKHCFECVAKELLDMGLTADFSMVQKLIEEVDEELKKSERLYIKLCAVDFNSTYIMEIQPEIHEKYKKKIKHIGIKIC